MAEMRKAYKELENLNERDHLENLVVDGYLNEY
jgi:hypothetical protein